MTTFLDSSALLRYVFNEGDVSLVLRALGGEPSTSAITLVEVPAAIYARFHRGVIAEEDRDGYLRASEQLLAAVPTIGLTAAVRTEAVRITAVHLVRSLDAIQMATAALERQRNRRAVRFCTADIRQSEAARGILGDANVDLLPPM